jgi:iron complex outermembrane recepter protein
VREDGVFIDYTAGETIYDYDVTFVGLSPYLHAEASPAAPLRFTAGLRLDWIGYDYDNRLGTLETGPHRRPGSTAISYAEVSPKLGATFDVGHGASVFASWSEGFRAPSEGQLFRQGVATNTVGLAPVEATSWEAGLRGAIGRRFSYALSGYRMTKTNDILTYQREDDVRQTQNAGETLHRGVELGLGAALPAGLVLETALSHAKHTYEAWRPDANTDYSGNEMESAPRTIGNTTLSWRPRGAEGPRVALEWVHLGEYWLNAANTEKYDGHDVLNLQGSWPVASRVTLFGKLNNLMGERYAENAGWSAFRGREFAPGMPRTLYAGAQVTWRGS